MLGCRLSKKVISLGPLWFPFIQYSNSGFGTHRDQLQDSRAGSFVVGVGISCSAHWEGTPKET